MNRNKNGNYFSLNRNIPASGRMYTPQEEYEQLKQQYPQEGIFKAQVYVGDRGFPIPNVKVEVTKKFLNGEYLIDTQLTDMSGLTQPIFLPAHPATESNQPGRPHPYTTYDVKFSHPDYTTVIVHNVAIFEGITSLQSMEMIPSGAASDGRTLIEYYVLEPDQING